MNIFLGCVGALALASAIPTSASALAMPDSTNGWGYGYDSLRRDLEVWRQHSAVRIDSIGASLQGRGIWMVTISDGSDSLVAVGRNGPKRRVIFHARTHPSEVQAEWVANEAIRQLLDTGAVAAGLRRDFVFHILPMYNPDGVEVGNPRQNAVGIDLESNWNRSLNTTQPEVLVLRARFEQMMAGKIPVEIALNLHSDKYNCTRFFFLHEPGGTSRTYYGLETKFVDGVRARFPGGIEPPDFISSWVDAPGLQYPEGFWWTHYAERVMALTYEDANCVGATGFDTTGRALVLGSADYLRSRPVAVQATPRALANLRREAQGIWIHSEVAGSWEWRNLDGRLQASGRMERGETLVPWGQGRGPLGLLVLRGADQSVQSFTIPWLR